MVKKGTRAGGYAPILCNKNPSAESVFTPEALLREARRQKGTIPGAIPSVCILDPDGDMVRQARRKHAGLPHPGWACYHTELIAFEQDGFEYGIIGCAVGASFATLIAEELFASGCELLLSITSAGQILPVQVPPYFIIIDRALRDEGTSYHYLPPGPFSEANHRLVTLAEQALAGGEIPVRTGASWTTDAPFRETTVAIEAARQLGILAVEMEAAALYAFAKAREKPVLCLAHVTNQMGQIEGDFEKGAADGAEESLRLVSLIARRWQGAW